MNRPLVSLFAAIFSSCVVAASTELPDIGSSSSKVLSLVEEQAVGDDYMRQIRALAPIVNDAEINDYVQHLGFKLVENNPVAQDRQFSFFVLRDNAINAFALPGGYIGIHTGLISKSENESELASVLSHEIAHVTQRHLARRLELQSQLTIPTLAAFAAAIIVATATKSGGDATIGAMTGAQGLAQQALINHTRSNEAEADRIGIATLYNSGFDTAGAVSFFEKMQENSRYYSNAFEFLRTHPLSRSRITDARLRAQEYPQRRVTDPLLYQLMKEKVKALTTRVNPVTIRLAEEQFKAGNLTTAERYGYAVFMIRAKRFETAETTLKSLRMANYKQPSFAIALAKLDIERKTPDNSIKTIKNMLQQSPGNLALLETLSELYIANTQFAEARELLLLNVHMTNHAPYLFKLLSEAQDGSGHRSEVFESEGNYLLAMGDLGGARIQYEQALNFYTDDPYARARINASINRIREYTRQRSLRH